MVRLTINAIEKFTVSWCDFVSVFLKLKFVSPLSFKVVLHKFCSGVLKPSASQGFFFYGD